MFAKEVGKKLGNLRSNSRWYWQGHTVHHGSRVVSFDKRPNRSRRLCLGFDRGAPRLERQQHSFQDNALQTVGME